MKTACLLAIALLADPAHAAVVAPAVRGGVLAQESVFGEPEKKVEKKDDKKDDKKVEKKDDKKDDKKDAKKDEKKDGKKKFGFGSEKCPCVGLANIDGVTKVTIGKNGTADYPADLGAYCTAWDNGRHPVACKDGQKPGKDNGWCKEAWCYVDPCNCELDEPPTKSPAEGSYLPDGQYQGKGLWYSYATCGGKDYWMTAEAKKKGQKEPKECKKKVDEKKWGDDKCKCIGIMGQPGTTNMTIPKPDGRKFAYPADVGASCQTWDKKSHPDCKGDKPADWCGQSWCYVDPCECGLTVPPKTSAYLPDAYANGKPVYYSYATCGGKDAFSATDKKACVNLDSEKSCKENSKCAWSGKECLGKELLEVCVKDAKDAKTKSGASGLTAGAALLLAAFSSFRA